MPVVSGGSYRSPLTVIDNEADEVYINAIRRQTEANALRAQKKLEQETARQKAANEQIKWTMDWTMKEQDKYLDQLKVAGNNNPQLASMFMQQINEMGSIAGRARTASTPEEQRFLLNQVGTYKQRLSSGSAAVQLMNDALSTFNEDVGAGLNTEGNLNLSNPEALEWAKKMAITAGRNPGTMLWFIDDDGDWAVRHEGERLEKPTDTKADVFFAYDPGIIPEYTKDIKEVLYNKLKLIDEKTGTVSDRFLTGQMFEGNFVPTADWVDEGNGMMREVFLTDMKKVANQLAPQLNPIATSYASNYYDSEGFYDSLPKDIKNKIMKEQGIGEDLEVGNAEGTQLNQKSLNAVKQGLLLSALPLVTKVKMGKSMKQTKPPGSGTGSGSGSGSKNKGLSVEANNFIKEIQNTPIEEIVQQLKNLDPTSTQKVSYNKSKNQVTIDDTETEGGEIMVYDLDNIKDFDVEAIAAGQGDAGQFFMRWISSKLGNTAKERKIKNEINSFLAKQEVNKNNVQVPYVDPNTGESLNAAELIKKYSNK